MNPWLIRGSLIFLFLAALFSFINGDATSLSFAALAVLTIWTILASPATLLTNTPHKLVDAIAGIGFLTLASRGVPSVSWSLLVGVALLLLAACIAGYSERKRVSATLLSFAFLLTLYVAVFDLLFRAAILLSPLGMMLFCVIGFLLSYTELARAKKMAHEIITLFHNTNGFILGVAGLLALRYALRTLYDIAHATRMTVYHVPSTIGLLLLALLPLYIWMKLFNTRTSKKQHIPDWHPALIAGATGLIVLTAFAPALTYAEGVLTLAYLPPARVLIGLVIGVFVALLWYVIGVMDEYLRRFLMVGPFFVAILYFGRFVYEYFVTLFLSYGTTTIIAVFAHKWVLVLPLALLFFIHALFILTAYLGFIYEMIRE